MANQDLSHCSAVLARHVRKCAWKACFIILGTCSQISFLREKVWTQPIILLNFKVPLHRPATAVFLVIEKASEMTSLLVILSSLVRKGVRLLSWIRDYMPDRQARVKFQTMKSVFKSCENVTPE